MVIARDGNTTAPFRADDLAVAFFPFSRASNVTEPATPNNVYFTPLTDSLSARHLFTSVCEPDVEANTDVAVQSAKENATSSCTDEELP